MGPKLFVHDDSLPGGVGYIVKLSKIVFSPNRKSKPVDCLVSFKFFFNFHCIAYPQKMKD